MSPSAKAHWSAKYPNRQPVMVARYATVEATKTQEAMAASHRNRRILSLFDSSVESIYHEHAVMPKCVTIGMAFRSSSSCFHIPIANHMI